MKVIVLAGGLGTRISEHAYAEPKPMISVGGKPLLWHIMQTYAYFGHLDFYVALGYKSENVKKFFLNYTALSSDFMINLSFQDICRSLENFLMSGTTYILTTNSVVSDNHVNNDIKSGHWREINLFDEPFNFPKEVLWKINDSVSQAPPTNMILLKREQIINHLLSH